MAYGDVGPYGSDPWYGGPEDFIFDGFGGWAVRLNGVILTDGCGDGQHEWDTACGTDEDTQVIEGLTDTPDGLGLPGLRTEDITFLQKDGVKHFADWYEPRLVTIEATIGPTGDCLGDDCTGTREQVFDIMDAWGRTCCDTEMVIYPPCAPADTQAGRAVTGPYGVVGRPRVAQLKWVRHDQQIADVLLRFDAVDHRLYILDKCGTPGYSNCETIDPGSEMSSMCFDEDGNLCFGGDGLCFDTPIGDVVTPTEITVVGTERVSPLITFFPDLSSPRIENLTTGETIQYNGVVMGSPVVVNTEDGTAFQDGVSVTHLLSGSFLFSMAPGDYEIRLLSSGAGDTGTAQFCWRDTVKMA